ncbi:1,4-beta-D-glucan glucohydrolase [Novosphingobium fuchskuhlense]|uniref:1,4-beta-D-glucan glucohydrolase n=1 Tax=Novosphingobium fuchskuhlense TaxID=1117702 RepID=A0A117UU01_9SPHN|nr:glycoside hydrolase family 3 protein [Novosphingobium fuchskuhlense]KUR70836.1 1,4-beta-D-glucan glucohydrolase [Novosphingobium fuchskuhlense]
MKRISRLTGSLAMRASAMVLAATIAPAAILAAPPAAPPGSAANVHPEQWPRIAWPKVVTDADEAKIAALLRQMDPACKVGQVIQGDIASLTPEDVARYNLGSVLNGGNSGPGNNDLAPARDWLKYADLFYAASMRGRPGCPAIPVIWGTDAVHGHSNIIGATLFPHNVGLGAMRDPDLIEKIGAATAAEIRVTGQEWTFAPTVTVPQDYRWGRAYEGYSSDPALVASYVGRMVRGLQGAATTDRVLAGPHVIASTKHFLADGGTTDGHDQGDAQIDEATLRLVHGAPYLPAIENGVATVMTSFSSWNGVKIAGNRGLVTDVLKDRLGFGGFVVTDWNAHGQIAGCTNASCPQALLAGVDMYMAPDSWKPLHASLLRQVQDGTVPMARLDDAVSRILRVKARLGLFEMGAPSTRPLSGQWQLLGSPEHRAIAREAVRKSLVLLKNTGILPLRKGARLLVAGDGADDVARQSGGWTISWQGTGLTRDQFPGATTLWEGLKSATEATGGSAQLAPDGRFSQKPDAAVVVFGEMPYAEFQGDIRSLQLRSDLTGPLATMKALKAQGIPVVAVMLTGRPLFVNPELNAADAFVVAWLPGSEGGGLADVLYAKDGADFTGRLPTAWPRSARSGDDPLFAYGYGLAMSGGPAPWTPLPEDPGVAAEAVPGVYLQRGQAQTGWSLVLTDPAAAPHVVGPVPAATPGGRIAITAIDKDVQEGARRIVVGKGAEPATIALEAASPRDLSRETNGDVLLLVTVKLDARPGAPVTLAARCGSGPCAAPLALPELAALPLGQWQTLAVPLKCLLPAGSASNAVSSPFVIATRGPLSFGLASVTLGTKGDIIAGCKSSGN